MFSKSLIVLLSDETSHAAEINRQPLLRSAARLVPSLGKIAIVIINYSATDLYFVFCLSLIEIYFVTHLFCFVFYCSTLMEQTTLPSEEEAGHPR